jgi:hypothetical protein
MTILIQNIEDNRAEYESHYENRSKYIAQLEFKLIERFKLESDLTKEMEIRLFAHLNGKFSSLMHEVTKEKRNREESLINLNINVESEIPKILEDLNLEKFVREQNDLEINNKIEEEFSE